MESNRNEQLFRTNKAVNGQKYCGVLSFFGRFFGIPSQATCHCFYLKNFLHSLLLHGFGGERIKDSILQQPFRTSQMIHHCGVSLSKRLCMALTSTTVMTIHQYFLYFLWATCHWWSVAAQPRSKSPCMLHFSCLCCELPTLHSGNSPSPTRSSSIFVKYQRVGRLSM